ncbi:MAG: hypothetical protein AAB116_16485 [Candidatus Poribacteria bacterium]
MFVMSIFMLVAGVTAVEVPDNVKSIIHKWTIRPLMLQFWGLKAYPF